MQLLPYALLAGLTIALIFISAPRFAFVAWAGVLFFVPIWVGFSAGVFYSAITFVTIVCLASAARRGLRWNKVDSVVLLLWALITASLALGNLEFGHWLVATVDWIVPYIWGRVTLGRIRLEFLTSVISLLTVASAVLALVEFATGFNIFSQIRFDNSGYYLWSQLQTRGSFLRVEGAFGHSISLGASLAIGSVFILTSRWRFPIRILALVVVGSAIVLTFSRIGLVAFVLGIVLSVCLLGRLLSVRVRLAIVLLASGGAAAALPFINQVFSSAGSEAGGSASYRVDLISLLSDMAPLGISSSYHVLPNGDVYFGDFQSIDSALILMGLRLGWIPLVLFAVLLVAAILLVFRTRSNVALIALVAQIPALATVALITQLPYLLFFVAGLAVSLYTLENTRTLGAIGAQVKLPVRLGERNAHG